MARSLLNASPLSVLAERVTLSINRRSFSSTSQGIRSNVLREKMAKKGDEKVLMKEKSESSWTPDPITGYYRPEDQANQIDAADLRKIFLNQRPKKH